MLTVDSHRRNMGTPPIFRGSALLNLLINTTCFRRSSYADGRGAGSGDDHFDSWFRHHTSERHLRGANKVGGEGKTSYTYDDGGGGGDHADVRDVSSFSSSSSDSSSSSSSGSSDSEEETKIIVSPDDPQHQENVEL